jgi:hypothetical protein
MYLTEVPRSVVRKSGIDPCVSQRAWLSLRTNEMERDDVGSREKVFCSNAVHES